MDVGYMNDLWKNVMGFSIYSLTFLIQHFVSNLYPFLMGDNS